MSAPKVVVTGAAGLIGRVLWKKQVEGWELVGIDTRPDPDAAIVEGSMLDQDTMIRLMDGASAVVHLGAGSHPSAPWKELCALNIDGTRAVLESARQAGLKRVVFASSNHVTGMYENDMPYKAILEGDCAGFDPERLDRITHEWPIRPDSVYGVSKAFGEALGRYYAEVFGMEVICLRIGTVNKENRPRSPRENATLLTHADLTSLIDACLRVEQADYAVLYGVSANTWRIWDLEAPRSVVGWVPRDNAEDFRETG
ncbi:MAG: NAD(P)-dependent oxidoreductase [Nitrospirota bacterium]|nr:NAD(P)-dependent oxidoreductase [Nitrospirota bacterium]